MLSVLLLIKLNLLHEWQFVCACQTDKVVVTLNVTVNRVENAHNSLIDSMIQLVNMSGPHRLQNQATSLIYVLWLDHRQETTQSFLNNCSNMIRKMILMKLSNQTWFSFGCIWLAPLTNDVFYQIRQGKLWVLHRLYLNKWPNSANPDQIMSAYFWNTQLLLRTT